MSLSVLLIAVVSQTGGYKDVPATHWAAKSINNLVTAGYMPAGNNSLFQGEKPVTRYEFAVMMNRFVDDMSRAYVRKPTKKTINVAKIRGRDSDGSKTAMIRLASEGYLPYWSPIFHGPGDTVSPEQFTVALGQVAQRLAWGFRSEDDGQAPRIGQRKKAEGGGGRA
ncbi:MAG: S-layer homology domain-containing protein [Fimbriimonadales bacterium]